MSKYFDCIVRFLNNLLPIIMVIIWPLIIILLIVAFSADFDFIDNHQKVRQHIDSNIINIHAASIILLTIALILVAYTQLCNLNKTSRGDFLLRIDDRYGSAEIIKARAIIHRLYRKSYPSGEI